MLMNTSLDTAITTSDHGDIMFSIIDSHKNWNALLHKEALKTKELKSILNNSLKVSKGSDLF